MLGGDIKQHKMVCVKCINATFVTTEFESMKIGIDFGTTNSAVCYMNEGHEVQAISFGSAQSQANYIPSCVAIRSAPPESVCIGRHARLKLGMTQHRVYTNFKMLLGESNVQKREKWGYADRTPDEVTALYFHHLIDDVRKHFDLAPKSVVVTIPEVWIRQGLLGKREHLINACKAAGIEHVKLHSEPLAASVYFLRLYRKKHSKGYTGHILVCDCGGGTMDFCLVKVEPGTNDKEQVTVLHRTGNGLVGDSLGTAGVAYDEAVTEALFPGLRQNNPEQFYEYLRKFEEHKIDAADEFTDKISTFRKTPSLAGDAFARVGAQGITASLLCQTFDTLIKPGLLKALEEMKSYQAEKNIKCDSSDHFRVLPVGGFSNYEPVMSTIKEFFDSRLRSDLRFATLLSPQDTALAIAKGAALIAEEQVEIVQLCPTTIGIVFLDSTRNHEKGFLPILKRDNRLDTYRTPVIAVRKLFYSPDTYRKLSIYFEIDGRPCEKTLFNDVGAMLPASYAHAPDGKYFRCGFSVDENLIFTMHLSHHAPDDKLVDTRATSLGKILDTLDGIIQLS
jgi:molecular chaperone DnaK